MVQEGDGAKGRLAAGAKLLLFYLVLSFGWSGSPGEWTAWALAIWNAAFGTDTWQHQDIALEKQPRLRPVVIPLRRARRAVRNEHGPNTR